MGSFISRFLDFVISHCEIVIQLATSRDASLVIKFVIVIFPFYFQASSSISAWEAKNQLNKQTCLLGWVNSLDDTSRRSYLIHDIETERNAEEFIKDKSFFSCEDFCRICHCGAEHEQLIAPCRCSGSTKYAHQSCLLAWIEMKKDKICELCLCEITVKRTGFKPPTQVL